MSKKIIITIVCMFAVATVIVSVGSMVLDGWESSKSDMKIQSETAAEQNSEKESVVPDGYVEHHKAPIQHLH